MPKKYFSNPTENSKFTFYCQNQFFALYHVRWNDVAHQAAQESMSNKAEPFNLIQIFPLLQPAPVTFPPALPYPH